MDSSPRHCQGGFP